MRLIDDHDGVLQIRWTWLPFWLAINPALKTQIEVELKAAVLMGGITNSDSDLDSLHSWLIEYFQKIFPDHKGLSDYLDGLKYVEEPD